MVIELNDYGRQIRTLERDVRNLRATMARLGAGGRIRGSTIIGTIPPASSQPQGSVTSWQNASGGARSAGELVVQLGNRTFTTTTTQGDKKAIGVVISATSVPNGSDADIRHNGYTPSVLTTGAVAVGDYLEASTTATRARSAGATATAGSIGRALTSSAGGSSSVAAYLFPPVEGSGSGGNGSVELVVAAVDSSAADIAIADFLCDGTADEVQVQAAIDALASFGGTVRLAPGSYSFAAQVLITPNKRYILELAGATITLAATIVGIKVNQTSGSGIRGVEIRNARIIGSGKAGTNVGIELEDTNNSSIFAPYITLCGTGILLESNAASAFVEGTHIDEPLIRDCTTGIKFVKVSGTGSFMQTRIDHMKIAACTTGFDVQNGSILMRSHVQGTIWIATGETGWRIDGNIEDTHLYMAVEGEGGSTGNTALLIGANAAQTEQAFLHLLLTGTIATQLDNTAGAKDFVFAVSGTTTSFATGFSRQSFRRHGDANDRFRIELITNGGRLSWGDGTAVVDTNLYRSAANVLASDDKIDPASFNLQQVSGTPVDGDVVGGAANGDLIMATASPALWGRIGGVWTNLSGSGGGHVIREDGSDLTTRTGLNFLAGLRATDDAGGNESEVTMDYASVWALA